MIHLFVSVCFFVSGAAGLVYQVLWTRMIDKVVGGAPLAVATVLSVFMAGLALGSFFAGKVADKLSSKNAHLWFYGILEIGIGVYAVVLPLLIAGAKPLYRFVYGQFAERPWCCQAAVFLLCALLLIVPASLMGATLPVLCRFYVGRLSHLGSRTGWLYGLNTIGAAFGAVLCGFVLIKSLGVSTTLYAAAGANGLVGVACILASRSKRSLFGEQAASKRPVSKEKKGKAVPDSGEDGNKGTMRWALGIFAVSGFCSMAYEVVWSRVLGLVAGPTTYSFTIVVATFIVGLALGGMLFGRLADRFDGATDKVFRLLVLTQWAAALLALAVGHLLGNSQFFFAKLIATHQAEFSRMIWVQAGVLFSILLGPTLFLGAAFPLVNRLYVRSVADLGSSMGRAYATNTVGAVLGAFVAGFVLVPLVGNENGLKAVIMFQCGMASVALVLERSVRRRKVALCGVGAAALCGGLLLFYPSWPQDQLSRGWYRDFGAIERDLHRASFADALFHGTESIAKTRQGLSVVFRGEGAGGFTTVEKEITSVGTVEYAMFNSGKADASSHGDRSTQALSAHIPMLFHPNPRNAMILGLASGMTSGEALLYPLERLDIVEINDKVVEACRTFFSPWNNRCLDDPRTRLIIQDGRNHLEMTGDRYDAIISEPSNPWMAGLANLYTLEFFRTARERLNENGIFAQWIQSYEMDWETFSMLGRTFATVFPKSAMVKVGPVDCLMMGFKNDEGLDWDLPERKREYASRSSNVYFPGVDFLAHLVMTEDLPALFGPGPIHTDNFPYLEFAAPMKLYGESLNVDEIVAGQRRLSPGTYRILQSEERTEVVLNLVEFSASANAPLFKLVDPDTLSPEQRERYRKAATGYCGQALVPSFGIFSDAWTKTKCANIQAEKISKKISAHGAYPNDYYNLGLAFLGAGRKAEAAVRFQNAIALDSRHEPSLTALGLLAAESGRFEEAADWLSKAVETAPGKVEPLKYLGMAKLRAGEARSAETHLAAALSLAPDDPAILSELGAAHAKQGGFQKAAEFFAKALHYNPGDEETRFNLEVANRKIRRSFGRQDFR